MDNLLQLSGPETDEVSRLTSLLPSTWNALDTEGYFYSLQRLFQAAFRLRRLSIGVDIDPTHEETCDYFKILADKFEINALNSVFIEQGMLPGLQYESTPAIPQSVLQAVKPEYSDKKWWSMNKHWRGSSASRPSVALVELETRHNHYRDVVMTYVDFLFGDEEVTQAELIYKFLTEQNGLFEGRRQSTNPLKHEGWQQLRALVDYKINVGFDVPGGKYAALWTSAEELYAMLNPTPEAKTASKSRSPKRRIVSSGSSGPGMKKTCLN